MYIFKTLKLKFTGLGNFTLLWSGQSLSQLGSSMTSFALIVWAYQKNGTALAIASLAVFSYLPYILVSLFAGYIIDNVSKKKILLICESFAALSTGVTFVLYSFNSLQLWHLYIINTILGLFNAFQQPASRVLTTLIVPEDKYVRASGMESFSGSVIQILAPVFASLLLSFSSLTSVLIIDFLSFSFAFLSLLFLVKIPAEEFIKLHKASIKSVFESILTGVDFIKKRIGLLYMMLFFSIINLIASMTYFSIFPAMILARSANNAAVLGIVNASVGFGGILGGIAVTLMKDPRNKIKTMFYSAALSFATGDILFGLGNSLYIWSIGGFLSSFFIPVLNGAENSVLQTRVPVDIQGRIFALRGIIQFTTIPVGYMIGGFLADKIFEPAMKKANLFTSVFGNAPGSGMALMFFFAGITGTVISLMLYNNKHLRALDND